MRAAPRARAAAGGHALRRQADHRRGRRASRRCRNAPASLREWLDAAACSTASAGCWRSSSGWRCCPTCSGARSRCSIRCCPSSFTNATSVRLMEHAATLDLEDFEDSELQDRLERARRQAAGRMTLMGQLFGQAQDVVTIASFAAGLVVYAPWLIVLLAIALVPAFLGEAHFNAQSYSLNYARTPERRELDYVRQTGASVETGEGSEDLRPERLPDRALPRAGDELLRRQPQARDAARDLGQPAHGDRDDRLLRRLRLHRLAHAARRVHDRRPHVPRRLVPAPAHAARGPADRASRRSPARRSISTTCSRSSRSSRRSSRRPTRGRFRRRSARASSSRTSASAIRAPSAGRCAISIFTLRAGEVLALVGENGAGKTTLVKLLARLYDPDEGRILLDGHDLREYDLFALRANIGVIFQDFVRYHLTAAENIAVGRIEARDDRARIVAAAERSLADEVIAKLPERLRPGHRQALPHRRRPVRRRVAEDRDRARLHARRAGADPRRADRRARRALRVRGVPALQGALAAARPRC